MNKEKIPAIPVTKEERRARNNRKLITVLILFFITILIILFFNSSLSKITSIEITGNLYLEEEDIRRMMDVALDDQYFLVNSNTAKENIEAIPEISSVTLTKTFPGKIVVQVQEHAAVALHYTKEGVSRVVLANGIEIDPKPEVSTIHLPLLSGWSVDDPQWIKLITTLAMIPAPNLADVSEILPIPSTSYPDKIKIYTRSRYEVHTAISFLEEMLGLLDNVIFRLKQEDENTGLITMLETVTWLPFGAGEETTIEQEITD